MNKKKESGNEVNWLTEVYNKRELMNFGLAVSRWHRYPKLAFTSVTDEIFIPKKNGNEL